MDIVEVLMAELRRRRKGMLGRRYNGNRVVGEVGMIVVCCSESAEVRSIFGWKLRSPSHCADRLRE